MDDDIWADSFVEIEIDFIISKNIINKRKF